MIDVIEIENQINLIFNKIIQHINQYVPNVLTSIEYSSNEYFLKRAILRFSYSKYTILATIDLKYDDVDLYADICLDDGFVFETIFLSINKISELHKFYDKNINIIINYLKKFQDQNILNELSFHLERAVEWAHVDDINEFNKFSLISSTFMAIKDGNVGLALERWNDLSSPNKPELSEEAQEWKPH